MKIITNMKRLLYLTIVSVAISVMAEQTLSAHIDNCPPTPTTQCSPVHSSATLFVCCQKVVGGNICYDYSHVKDFCPNAPFPNATVSYDPYTSVNRGNTFCDYDENDVPCQ